MSSSRHGTSLSWYSDSPVRNSVRVIVTSEKSIGSSPALLSIVSATSARPERLTLRGAREDDVVHLPAAQRARALRSQHPGNRVDEVRLARAVRADDHRDPWLEVERGLLRERLEALDRQRLQEQPLGSSSRAGPGPPRPRATDRSDDGRRAPRKGDVRAWSAGRSDERTSSANGEAPLVGRELLAHLDPVHPGPRRALVAPPDEACDRVRGTLEGGLDPTVREVPDPPVDARRARASVAQPSRNHTFCTRPDTQRCRRTLRPGTPGSSRWIARRPARAR